MINQQKVQLFKKVGTISVGFLLVVLCLGMGYKIGCGYQQKIDTTVRKQKIEEVKKKENRKQLSQNLVKDFLYQFYTKKDLGENRNRYEPFVTKELYDELVSKEEQPVNQVYKGYTVDQVFTKSEIYIDEQNLTAVCVVDYKNTQRMKLKTDEGALKNQTNQENIKLTFVRKHGKCLVNKIEPVTYEVLSEQDKNSYPEEGTNLKIYTSEEDSNEKEQTQGSTKQSLSEDTEQTNIENGGTR